MNENDQEAARILSDWIHEHSPMILRTAYYYVKDRMVSEDIAQEVFLRAYRSMGDFRGEAGVRTWLYRITVNACRSNIGK